jgi:hypothetical protein
VQEISSFPPGVDGDATFAIKLAMLYKPAMELTDEPSLYESTKSQINTCLEAFFRERTSAGTTKDERQQLGLDLAQNLFNQLDRIPGGGEICSDQRVFKCLDAAFYRNAKVQFDGDDGALAKMAEANGLSEEQVAVYTECYRKTMEVFHALIKEKHNRTPEGLKEMGQRAVGKFQTQHSFKDTQQMSIPIFLGHVFAAWSISRFLKERNNLVKSTFHEPLPSQILCLLHMLDVTENRKLVCTALNRPAKPAKPVKDILTASFDGISDFVRGTNLRAPAIQNSLALVKTGQGKSLVTGALAVVLAVATELEVDVGCYSQHLVTRDEKGFKDVFKVFGVEERIHYGIFRTLVEKQINARGDIRKHTRRLLHGADGGGAGGAGGGRVGTRGAGWFSAGDPAAAAAPPRILIIDEVDVLLKEEFFGNVMNLVAEIKSDDFYALCAEIWSQVRAAAGGVDKIKLLEHVKRQQAYGAFLRNFQGDTVPLIKGQILRLMNDAANFDAVAHSREFPYKVVFEDGVAKIAYKDGDSYSTKALHGFDSIWIQFHERDRNHGSSAPPLLLAAPTPAPAPSSLSSLSSAATPAAAPPSPLGGGAADAIVTDASLRANISLAVQCGTLSYAKLADDYPIVLGVSGTLPPDGSIERKICTKFYRIKVGR